MMKEQQRHRDAFEVWYNLPKRSDERVAKKVGVSPTSVRKWRNNFNWDIRGQKRDEKLGKKMDEKVTDKLADFLAQLDKVGQLKIAKGAKYLRDNDPKTITEANKLTESGKEDRLRALGEPDQTLHTTGEQYVSVEQFREMVNEWKERHKEE